MLEDRVEAWCGFQGLPWRGVHGSVHSYSGEFQAVGRELVLCAATRACMHAWATRVRPAFVHRVCLCVLGRAASRT